MASARKKGASKAKPAKGTAKKKASAKAKPAPKPKRPAVAKKAPARKPAAKAVKPAKPVKAAKPSKPAKPAPKPVAKVAAKPVAKPVAKAAVKAAPPAKGAKAAAKAAPPAKGGKAAPPAPPVRTGPPRLVPVATDSRARSAKPPTGKSRLVSKAPAEVRPLGVLPPESIARPRHTPGRSPAPPMRSSSASAPAKPVTPKKGDDRLSPDDLKDFEGRLLAERTRIMREMGHLESTVLKVNPRDSAGELSGYSFHMADAGTDSMEREKAFDIASKEGRLLLEIDDALRRVYGGTYGLCEASGKPISRARLEALPWARLSLEEQEKLEKEQRAGRNAPGAE